MKSKEIRQLTDEEVAKGLRDNRRESFNLRLQKQTGQLTNTARVRQVRRDVARLMTEQSARLAKAAVKDGK